MSDIALEPAAYGRLYRGRVVARSGTLVSSDRVH